MEMEENLKKIGENLKKGRYSNVDDVISQLKSINEAMAIGNKEKAHQALEMLTKFGDNFLEKYKKDKGIEKGHKHQSKRDDKEKVEKAIEMIAELKKKLKDRDKQKAPGRSFSY